MPPAGPHWQQGWLVKSTGDFRVELTIGSPVTYYSVQYSTDGGDTWHGLAYEHHGPGVPSDAALLQACRESHSRRFGIVS